MSQRYNIAVVGATGIIGRETLEILAERNFPVNKIFTIASNESLGKKVSFGEQNLHVDLIDDINWDDIDIIFAAAGSEVTHKLSKISKAVIIDKSSAYRLDKLVPLVIPEINRSDISLYKNKNIISNPNCCVIPIALSLYPLMKLSPIKRIVISTYQSVSGGGKDAMESLYNQTKQKFVYMDDTPHKAPNFAFNIIAKIGALEANNYTGEENKIISELQRILGEQIQITATAVRVPVFVGHSFSVNVEFMQNITISDIKNVLQNNWIKVEEGHMEPIDVSGKDQVFISRIRQDTSCENAINMWIVADNLRRGAALNSVQIAEQLINL